jgi:hypothetical protein
MKLTQVQCLAILAYCASNVVAAPVPSLSNNLGSTKISPVPDSTLKTRAKIQVITGLPDGKVIIGEANAKRDPLSETKQHGHDHLEPGANDHLDLVNGPDTVSKKILVYPAGMGYGNHPDYKKTNPKAHHLLTPRADDSDTSSIEARALDFPALSATSTTPATPEQSADVSEELEAENPYPTRFDPIVNLEAKEGKPKKKHPWHWWHWNDPTQKRDASPQQRHPILAPDFQDGKKKNEMPENPWFGWNLAATDPVVSERDTAGQEVKKVLEIRPGNTIQQVNVINSNNALPAKRSLGVQINTYLYEHVFGHKNNEKERHEIPIAKPVARDINEASTYISQQVQNKLKAGKQAKKLGEETIQSRPIRVHNLENPDADPEVQEDPAESSHLSLHRPVDANQQQRKQKSAEKTSAKNIAVASLGTRDADPEPVSPGPPITDLGSAFDVTVKALWNWAKADAHNMHADVQTWHRWKSEAEERDRQDALKNNDNEARPVNDQIEERDFVDTKVNQGKKQKAGKKAKKIGMKTVNSEVLDSDKQTAPVINIAELQESTSHVVGETVDRHHKSNKEKEAEKTSKAVITPRSAKPAAEAEAEAGVPTPEGISQHKRPHNRPISPLIHDLVMMHKAHKAKKISEKIVSGDILQPQEQNGGEAALETSHFVHRNPWEFVKNEKGRMAYAAAAKDVHIREAEPEVARLEAKNGGNVFDGGRRLPTWEELIVPDTPNQI